MNLLKDIDKPPFFILTNIFRGGNKTHYFFVGKYKYKEHKNTINNILSGKKVNNISSIFGQHIFNAIKEHEKNRDKIKINFVDKMIWLNDNIFDVKIKIFSYLSSLNKNIFFIKKNQLLLIDVNDKKMVIDCIYKNNNKVYIPEFDIEKNPEIDENFVDKNDIERNKYIKFTKNQTIIYDILNNFSTEFNIPLKNKEPHIYFYNLEDEFKWLKENTIFDNKISNERIWWGYIKKYWNSSDRKTTSDIIKKYNINKEIISNSDDIYYGIYNKKILKIFGDYNIGNYHLETVVNKENTSILRLELIYNFLRTKLSKTIPYIFYKNEKKSKPSFSIYKNIVNYADFSEKILLDWIFKIENEKYVFKGEIGTILIKYITYFNNNKDFFSSTIKIKKSGSIDIISSPKDKYGMDIKNFIELFNKYTRLLSTINNNFLKIQNMKQINIDDIGVKNEEFKMNNIKVRFYSGNFTIILNKKVKLINLLKYFKKFINLYIVPLDQNIDNNLKLIYKRTSKKIFNFENIFDIIKKELKNNKNNDNILNLLMNLYGTSKEETSLILEGYKMYEKGHKYILDKMRKNMNDGINIEIKKQDVKTDKIYITIRGLKTLFMFRECIFSLLYVFSNFLKSDKNISNITNKLLKQDINVIYDNKNYISFSDNIENNIQSANNNNINSNFLLKNIGDIDDINNDIKNNIKKNNNFTSTENINMSNESNIDLRSRVKCKNKELHNKEKGFCKRVCDFPAFRLNRLKHFEPSLYDFKAKINFNTYSRQIPERQRPIIVTYNPDKISKIDRTSYTKYLKHKSSENSREFYYMCPNVWCPTCEIPIPLKKVKDIKIFKKCKYGICPNGNHQVIINESGKKHIYPRLMPKSRHPNNLQMVSCVIKDKPNYKPNDNYIYKSDNVPLEKGRFGILPTKINNLLEQTLEQGTFKVNTFKIVRKGIEIKYKKTFMNCIIDVVSFLENKQIDIDFIINKIVSNVDDKIFISLGEGLFKRIFKTKEKYFDFLKNNVNSMTNFYIWDILTRPGIIIKSGLNIVILQEHSFVCPNGLNVRNIYFHNRPTILISLINNYYEPLYNIKYNSKINKLIINPIMDTDSEIIQNIINIVLNKCISYDEIDWEKVTSKKIEPEPDIYELSKSIKNVYTIKTQFIDNYHKVSGVLLNNGLYIPIKPSQLIVNIPFKYHEKFKDVNNLTLKKTITLLTEFCKKTKLNLYPKYFISYKKSDIIIGLLLTTKRIIPIDKIKYNKKIHKLPISKYFAIDNFTITNKLENNINERKRKVNLFEYKIELFEKYKYEVSRFLQTKEGNTHKLKINNLFDSDLNNSKNINKLKIILEQIYKKLISPSISKSLNKIKNTILNNKNILRNRCSELTKDECKKDIYCINNNNSCKIINYDTKNYTEQLLYILLNYPIKKEEILSGAYSMININKVKNVEQENEIYISGNTVDNVFKKIFKKDYSIIKIFKDDIEFKVPIISEDFKKKYLIEKKGIQKNIKIISTSQLTTYWKPIINPIFNFTITNNTVDSFYYCMVTILNNITEGDKLFNMKTVKNYYSSYLLGLTTDEIKLIASSFFSNKQINNLMNAVDLYNLFYPDNAINKLENLMEKIKIDHMPKIFDLAIFSYILQIKLIILKKSI